MTSMMGWTSTDDQERPAGATARKNKKKPKTTMLNMIGIDFGEKDEEVSTGPSPLGQAWGSKPTKVENEPTLDVGGALSGENADKFFNLLGLPFDEEEPKSYILSIQSDDDGEILVPADLHADETQPEILAPINSPDSGKFDGRAFDTLVQRVDSQQAQVAKILRNQNKVIKDLENSSRLLEGCLKNGSKKINGAASKI
eukprot:FR738052.1.p1 GENE.FR738052.1~~FR738052.1.p1  ORF type:complete len:217 (+),score=30.69 FR738052.1:56-652(+)